MWILILIGFLWVALTVGKEEEEKLNNRLLRERTQAETYGLLQDIEERKAYASKIFKLICSWIGGVFFILVMSGFQLHFKLSDSVLIALVGGTTASVIGIFVVVANYLFPKR